MMWVLTDEQVITAGAEASAPLSCLHISAVGGCTRLMSNDWVWHVDAAVLYKGVKCFHL